MQHVSLPFEGLLTAVPSILRGPDRYRVMIKSLGFGSRSVMFKFQPLHLQAVGLCVALTSLSLLSLTWSEVTPLRAGEYPSHKAVVKAK